MSYLDRYKVPFGNLTNGEQEFEFEIDDKFFEQFENSAIEHGFADILVTINKKEHMLLVDFTIDGTLGTQCDRCGEDLDVEVTGFNELMIKFGEETGEEDADVIILSPKEHELDLGQFIYEYVTLLLPMRHVHPDDENGKNTCNPETLEKLEKLTHHEEEPEKTDPRWDILKNINLN